MFFMFKSASLTLNNLTAMRIRTIIYITIWLIIFAWLCYLAWSYLPVVPSIWDT